ncbi:MAG: membrane-associated [Planctomycetota bacterium]|nr:MAG: membrane-associated [Planctomycetota bacterium]
MSTLKEWLHWLKPEVLIAWGGLTGLIAIVFAETGLMIGFVLPGDSLLFTAGLFASTGRFKVDITVLNVSLMAAAIVGDAVGFWTGAKAGKHLFRREDSRFFKKQHLLRAKAFYEKHGAKTIVLARFVPIIRTFAPMVAGAAEMKYRTFVIYNVLGAIGWVGSMTVSGYVLGRSFPWIGEHIHWVALGIIAVSFIPVAIEVQRARREAAEEKKE